MRTLYLPWILIQALAVLSTPNLDERSVSERKWAFPLDNFVNTEGGGSPSTIDKSRAKFTLRALPNMASLRNLDTADQENATEASMNKAVKFMRTFGYIPAGDDNADFIYSAETLGEKLKLVQKFGAIPETGELDAATVKLMTTPRCGVKDIDPEEGKRRRKRFIKGSSGWNKRNITYNVANWSPKLMSKENVQMELRRAFDHWSSYSRLKFTETSSQNADIIIFFAEYSHYDNYPFDGQGGILAHAYYPYEFGHYGGDIHFDESEDWNFRPEDDYSGLDFFTVAVHEIGHSLGLAHSPVSTSIMFPYYKGVETNFALDYDDIMGMWDLYIKRKLDGDEEYFKMSTTTTTPTTTTTTTTTAPSYDVTQNDEGEDNVRYHGDYETVDEHEERQKGNDDNNRLPSLPPLFPDYEGDNDDDDDDYYERERKRREEEERRRRKKEEEEEEERRKRWEEEREREAEERKREGEKERRRWEEEEEERRKEEEERRRWEEEEEERRRRRKEEEERRRWEEEKRRREWETSRTTTVAQPTDDVIDDVCGGNLDSVAVLRNELFIFKGKHMWRYERKGQLLDGYPARIRSMFSNLPNWIQKIDAAYERKNDSRIVFFVGKYFYVYDGIQLVEGSPRPITEYGLPDAITQIDAAFFWPKNQKTYLFRRNLYWRRDDFSDKVDENYPRGMKRWNGVPQDLDTVVTDEDGLSYFFKGNRVWQFDNVRIRPTFDSPSNDLRRWTGC